MSFYIYVLASVSVADRHNKHTRWHMWISKREIQEILQLSDAVYSDHTENIQASSEILLGNSTYTDTCLIQEIQENQHLWINMSIYMYIFFKWPPEVTCRKPEAWNRGHVILAYYVWNVQFSSFYLAPAENKSMSMFSPKQKVPRDRSTRSYNRLYLKHI